MLVTVIDTTLPVFTDSQVTKSISEVSTFNWVNWTTTDLHVANYTIYQYDGFTNTSVNSGNWISGVPIGYNIDSLTKGTYTFHIAIQDNAGNMIVNSVIITVEDQTIPSIDVLQERQLPKLQQVIGSM